jgi:hypothetical protein
MLLVAVVVAAGIPKTRRSEHRVAKIKPSQTSVALIERIGRESVLGHTDSNNSFYHWAADALLLRRPQKALAEYGPSRVVPTGFTQRMRFGIASSYGFMAAVRLRLERCSQVVSQCRMMGHQPYTLPPGNGKISSDISNCPLGLMDRAWDF